MLFCTEQPSTTPLTQTSADNIFSAYLDISYVCILLSLKTEKTIKITRNFSTDFQAEILKKDRFIDTR